LPTRVAIGFTHGERIDREGRAITVVRQRNAHAWVEVWLDQEGWVSFDPTPRGDTFTAADNFDFDPGDLELSDTDTAAGVIPELQPGQFDDLPLPGGDLLDAETVNRSTGIGRWLVLAALLVVTATAVPALKGLRRRRRLRRARQGDISAVWAEIVDRLSDLGAGPAGNETPIEFALSTNLSLVPLARAYSAAIYGGRPTTGTMNHLRSAERWIENTYGTRSRHMAAFRLRSLTKSPDR
ncbi:MAG: transglutaminase-like domain-containing protein, partial [Acidimicrobiia bacterium]